MKDTKPAAKRRTPARKTTARAARASSDKGDQDRQGVEQAVVIIHGMGEQRPMEMLRSFVRAVWSTDLELTDPWGGKRTIDPDTGHQINRSWIVPDRRTGSHELRRITTPRSKKGAVHKGLRTDFYELYWADLIRETPAKRLLNWIRGRLFTRWSEVPKDAVGLYILAWVALLFGVAPAIITWAVDIFAVEIAWLPKWALTVWAGIVSLAMSKFLIPYLGDVADYVQATPDTVSRRAAVRQRGFELLKKLNNESGYDRIILVGHSLGSVIGYDLLQMLWADYGPNHRNPRKDRAIGDALDAVGKYALPLGEGGTAGTPIESAEDRAAYRKLQWNLYELLRRPSKDEPKVLPWKFSDFVSLGSPLTHAEFLIARSEKALERAVEERLFAMCPPISDKEERATIVYKTDNVRHAHHASVFAATRWTNIYDLGNTWSTGDPFSGKAGGNFGPGVRDIRVKLESKFAGFRSRLFTHTFYWTDLDNSKDAPPHIVALREALDLQRSLETGSR